MREFRAKNLENKSFTGFYLVLDGFTEFYSVLEEFSGFYWL